jgi:two-component system OmpR family response regulator
LKLLVVEDDARLRDVVVRALRETGHVVEAAGDGATGEALGADDTLDAIVLDIMLPVRDGLSVVRSLRRAGVATPILLLTARSTEADTVAGLDAGADDYLRKPFGIAELQARIRSLARRQPAYRPTVVQRGTIAFDSASRRARRGNRQLELTLRESAFLEYFLHNAGRALSRDAIAAALWPADADIASNVIDVYVRRLRTKLHGPGEPRVLSTVRGVGYRFEAE